MFYCSFPLRIYGSIIVFQGRSACCGGNEPASPNQYASSVSNTRGLAENARLGDELGTPKVRRASDGERPGMLFSFTGRRVFGVMARVGVTSTKTVFCFVDIMVCREEVVGNKRLRNSFRGKSAGEKYKASTAAAGGGAGGAEGSGGDPLCVITQIRESCGTCVRYIPLRGLVCVMRRGRLKQIYPWFLRTMLPSPTFRKVTSER